MRNPLLLLTLLSAVAMPSLAAGPSLEEQARGLFKPLPARFDSKTNPITPEKVALGRLLFFDKRLSKNHDVSCNSCHALDKYGVDGLATSTGHRQQKGGRNAPTVYNCGDHLSQFWDGRAGTLEDQAKGPVLNPVEMAMKDAAAVEQVVSSIPGYTPLFAKAFPGEQTPITFDRIALAIGAFERTLVTPSRFDGYLRGDANALDAAEKKGLGLFISQGCVACHNGAAVGAGMYQKLGLVEPVSGLKDEGRVSVTKDPEDKFRFKVPSLRNIDKTGPYLHDGSIAKLDEVVVFMAKHQLGKVLPNEDVASIMVFLGVLTGPLPKDLSTPKTLPAGKLTPKGDPT
jgi:cytochrome c peroxidase